MPKWQKSKMTAIGDKITLAGSCQVVYWPDTVAQEPRGPLQEDHSNDLICSPNNLNF